MELTTPLFLNWWRRMSLEEILCRHATQFLAVSLQKPKSSAPTTLRDSRGLEAYIAVSAKRKLNLAGSSNGCNRRQYIQRKNILLKTDRPWGYESQRNARTTFIPHITPINEWVAVERSAFMRYMRNEVRYESRQNLGKILAGPFRKHYTKLKLLRKVLGALIIVNLNPAQMMLSLQAV